MKPGRGDSLPEGPDVSVGHTDGSFASKTASEAYPRSVLAAASRHFEACHPAEGCGAIVRMADGGMEFRPIRNAADRPDAFEFDLGEQLELWLAQDRGELEILAIAHSHCDAPALPSARDLAAAWPGEDGRRAFPGVDWLIFSIDGGKDPEGSKGGTAVPAPSPTAGGAPRMTAGRAPKCVEIRGFLWGEADAPAVRSLARPAAGRGG